MKFIYPPTIQWEGAEVFQRPQQLMKAFAAAGHEAVFMERGRADGSIQLREGVQVTGNGYRNEKPQTPTILWVTHPPHFRMKQMLQADFIVFDYIDECTEEFGMWHNADLRAAMEAADIITVVSQRLLEIVMAEFPGKPVLLVPNGVDSAHYADAAALPVPMDMASLPRPILGFMGSISTWIDGDILRRVAELRPDWTLLLIGPDYITLKLTLSDLPNVVFPGRKLYGELPAYVGHFDVGLIPFQVRNMTNSSSPLKMYEYMAAGVPVVSTPIREAVNSEPVLTGQTAEEWVSLIEGIMEKPTDRDELIRYAQSQEWKVRIAPVVVHLMMLGHFRNIAQADNRINSRNYWNTRFQNNWEQWRGRDQTSFFARLMLEHLPDWLVEDIRMHKLGITDLGCAEGDGVQVLSEAFPEVRLTGVDFSEVAIMKATRHYPQLLFRVGDVTAIKEEDSDDVLLTSNTLEHLRDPIAVIRRLARITRRYLIVLVPYRESEPLTDEHQYRFDDGDFPEWIEGCRRMFCKVIDCRRIPGTKWDGDQLLAVYSIADRNE